MGESDFDAVSHQELAQSIVDRRNTVPQFVPNTARQSHEIAVGNDQIMSESVSVGTGAMHVN